MKTDDIRKMGLAYLQVQEAEKKNKHGHDAVGHEDGDIDNDGDKDKSDDYLHNRRKAIKANMKNEALVGNQHKIDANKNGKVDAHDFHLLRKGKKVQKEEVEQIEWPVFNRIMEKSDKFTVKYSVSGVGDDPHQIDMKFADPNHVKGATKAETIDDKWSEGEKNFAKQHGMLGDFNDSGIHGHKAAAHTAKAAVANVKAAPGRPNDSKIGDKAMPKSKG